MKKSIYLFGRTKKYIYICSIQKQKKEIMKTSITFDIETLRNFTNLIFKTTIENGWQKEWELLTDKNGNTFDDINDAKQFIRETGGSLGIGLATFEQAKLSNAQWDNF